MLLHKVPSYFLELRLNNKETCIAAALNLRVNLVQQHKCSCEVNVEESAIKSLSGRKSTCRRYCHSVATDVKAPAFKKAEAKTQDTRAVSLTRQRSNIAVQRESATSVCETSQLRLLGRTDYMYVFNIRMHNIISITILQTDSIQLSLF